MFQERREYEQAKRRALGWLRKGFNLGFTPPKSRDELHQRGEVQRSFDRDPNPHANDDPGPDHKSRKTES